MLVNNVNYEFRTTRVGIASLVLVAIAACSFPALQAFGSWAAALVIVGYFTFALAMVGCIYSVIAERPKAVGILGLAAALITVLVERGTLYFVGMEIFLIPAYGLAYMLFVIVRRLFRPAPLTER